MGLFILGLVIGLVVAAVMVFLYNKLETRLIFTQNQLQRQMEIAKSDELINVKLRKDLAERQINYRNLVKKLGDVVNAEIQGKARLIIVQHQGTHLTGEDLDPIITRIMLSTLCRDPDADRVSNFEFNEKFAKEFYCKVSDVVARIEAGETYPDFERIMLNNWDVVDMGFNVYNQVAEARIWVSRLVKDYTVSK